jgi:ribosomal-protein-alanine N-acetyltransferase
MRIETDRLIIRDLQPDDVAALVALWTDPDVTAHMGGPRVEAELREILEADLQSPSADPFDLWPVEEKATGQVVGDCGFLEKGVDGQQEIELVYVLAKSVWGKGYATEAAVALRNYAFQHMGLTRLISLIDPENTASERVALKSGMRYEKDTVRPSGKVMRVYSVLRR